MHIPAIRELPVGARQQAKCIHIPSEQCTEPKTVGYTGCARYSANRVPEAIRNKSGTAEVTLHLCLLK